VPISETQDAVQTHQPAAVEVSDEDDLLDQVLAAGKLVVATDANYAPWSFINDQGELDGFDVDVGREVAARLGVDVEFVTPDWEAVIGGGWDAQWDVSIGSMTPTDERAEVLWFTDPYYYNSRVFVLHKDNTTITTPEDLAGKSVGGQLMFPTESYLTGILDMGDYGGVICYPPPEGVNAVYYVADHDALEDLTLGDGFRLDAALVSQLTLALESDFLFFLKYMGTAAFSVPLVFALDQARGPSGQMLAALNAIIAEMHSDCSLSWISIKWIGMDITKPCPAAPSIGPMCNAVFLPLVTCSES
jgi:polar amino acid transport system substrate-binding protein